MMKKTVSDANIISFLNAQTSYVSADQIAHEFNVSSKTIYRRINKINQDNGKGLIRSERGKGYRLAAAAGDSLQDKQILHEKPSPNNPKRRRKNVLLKLLFSSPKFISIEYLFKDEFVSESTIVADLLKIKAGLKDFNLQLVQKNKRAAVLGKEKNIRETINSFLQYEKENKQTIPIAGITQIDASFIQQQLNFIQNISQKEIPYPYNINIYSHLYILIQRVRNQSSRSQNIYNESLGVTQDEIDHYPKLYRIAEMVIENVGNYVVKSMPNFEVDYLFRYLLSSRLIGQDEGVNEKYIYSPLVERYTTELIKGVSQQLNYTFDERQLKSELIRHIGPMINRIENNISVENALLTQIKYEYHELYQVVLQECANISKQLSLPQISGNEVGFITLYFEKSIEMVTRSFHVWIVCSSGVGTSELLKLKIEREFKNIIVDRVTSSFDQNLYKTNKRLDLIITTVKLSHQVNVKTVLVSALLNDYDKKKIRDALYD